MKKLLLSSMLVVSVGAFAQQEPLKVRSIEKHFDRVSNVIEKSSVATPVTQAIAAKSNNPKAADHTKKQTAVSLRKKGLQAYVNNADFWIYDATVVYHDDDDGDGYFSRFSVEFDADTNFTSANVYARLYLARTNTFEEFHTTSTFNILGDSTVDAFTVDSELVTGFPPAQYEMMIELYDAHTNKLVVVYDARDNNAFANMSLESKSFEQRPVDQVVVIAESGGSLGYLMLFAIPLLVLRQIKRR